MKSRNLAVQFGLVVVLLMSLSAAAVADIPRITQSTSGSDVALQSYAVATPHYHLQRTWRGAIIVTIECDTPGATIWYTWNGSSVRTYRNPLYVTRDAVIYACATKYGYETSNVRKLVIDFWPYGNVR